MSVRSHNYDPQGEAERPRRGSALFSRAKLAKQQTATERFIAFVLLAISFIGIVLFGGGGAGAWLKLQPSLIGAVSGFAVQCVCTRVQWVYASRRWTSPWWLIAFGISTAGTLAGFWPLLHEPIVEALEWAKVPAASAPSIAGGLLVIVASLLDYLPEQILTD